MLWLLSAQLWTAIARQFEDMMRNFLTIFAVLTFWSLAVPQAFSQDGEESWLFERKILGDNNLLPVGDISGTAEYNYAAVVARVERLDGSPFCTASRVGKNLFITNFHCTLFCNRGCQCSI